MKIVYLHASRFGNGVIVATEFERLMSQNGSRVDVHHIRDVDPRELAAADLYVFSSPGRMGRPIRRMRRFLAKLDLPAGTRYAVFTTEMAPRADSSSGELLTAEQRTQHQRVIPIMNEMLQRKGLVKVTDGNVYVTGMKGPLEDEWRDKVAAFVATINASDGVSADDKQGLRVGGV